jgi:hypothetical protein
MFGGIVTIGVRRPVLNANPSGGISARDNAAFGLQPQG